MMQKKGFGAISEILRNFRKGIGGGPIITSGLWLSWVILPASWSLVPRKERKAGNWSRPALEARWRIFVVVVHRFCKL